MEKATTYALVGAMLILIAGAFYAGWHLRPAPAPQVTHTTDTLRLTQRQLDSLDAAYYKKLVIVKRGMSVRGVDTLRYEDSTQIRGLLSLLDEYARMTERYESHVCAPQNAVSAPTGASLSVGMGGLYHFKDAGLMPVASLGIKHKKNSIHPLLGYYKGLMAGVVYERQF